MGDFFSLENGQNYVILENTDMLASAKYLTGHGIRKPLKS